MENPALIIFQHSSLFKCLLKSLQCSTEYHFVLQVLQCAGSIQTDKHLNPIDSCSKSWQLNQDLVNNLFSYVFLSVMSIKFWSSRMTVFKKSSTSFMVVFSANSKALSSLRYCALSWPNAPDAFSGVSIKIQ